MFTKGGSQSLGGVECILPGFISGWLYNPAFDFTRIRLMAGLDMIAEASIDLPRPDVSSCYNIKTNVGFRLDLPSQIPPFTLSIHELALEAVNEDGSVAIDVVGIDPSIDPKKQLLSVLKSDCVGSIGHCDGFDAAGFLTGWAYSRNQVQPAKIWLHVDGEMPLQIRCNLDRGGLDVIGVPSNSGFRLSLRQLPSSFLGKELTCTFDSEGLFSLPPNVPIFLPQSLAEIELQLESSTLDDCDKLDFFHAKSSEKHLSTWMELAQFRNFLTEVESDYPKLFSTQTKKSPFKLFKKFRG